MDIGKFQVTSSNPGQTYYNTFAAGEPGETILLDWTIPRPYITKGAQPIHAYAAVDTSTGFFDPSEEVSFSILNPTDLSETPSGAFGISLEDYGGNDSITIMISATIPDSGFIYFNIHLDYGLKRTAGYINADGDAISDEETILNLQSYEFGSLCVLDPKDEIIETSDTQTVQSQNDFKKFRGIVVLVVDDLGDPAVGVNVILEKSNGDPVGDATTDENGLAFIEYHHKGKKANYEVVLGGLSETITLSGKTPYAFVDFEVP